MGQNKRFVEKKLMKSLWQRIVHRKELLVIDLGIAYHDQQVEIGQARIVHATNLIDGD